MSFVVKDQTCRTCSWKYSDYFCMRVCMYVNDEHSCGLWTDEPIEFDYDRIYRLCKDFLELCKDWETHQRLKEEHPEIDYDKYMRESQVSGSLTIAI